MLYQGLHPHQQRTTVGGLSLDASSPSPPLLQSDGVAISIRN